MSRRKKEDFYTYVEARTVAQALGIKSGNDYKKRYLEDPRLPSNPNGAYADAGWTDWYDFLDNKKPDPYATYAEARTAAQALGIKDGKDYKARYRQDPRLPVSPYLIYADGGWTDWYDFLGKEKRNLYPTYAEAKAAAKALGIEDSKAYKKRYPEDPRLPASPNKNYAATGWTDWYDFLDNKKRDPYATYAEAQTAALALGIKDAKDYKARYRLDPSLPACPYQIYADAGWTDWYDFLDNKKPDPYATYAEAQTSTQALGIKGKDDYAALYRLDPRLPANPDKTYAHAGWLGWYDYLGKEKSPWYTYGEAQAVVQVLGIENSKAYQTRYSEDPRLPSSPYQTYADAGWMGWHHFLGKKKRNSYPTYAEAKAATQALGIKSQPDYYRHYRQDPRLPSNPVKGRLQELSATRLLE